MRLAVASSADTPRAVQIGRAAMRVLEVALLQRLCRAKVDELTFLHLDRQGVESLGDALETAGALIVLRARHNALARAAWCAGLRERSGSRRGPRGTTGPPCRSPESGPSS